jgi:hypothetical protein
MLTPTKQCHNASADASPGMRIRKPLAILGSPLFIASVVLLLVNDHYLKSVLPGLVTGKLSDVAGLFAFASFFSALLPRRRLIVHIVTALGFILWKMPAADIIIDAANDLLPFAIGRTIDYGDLWTLLVLPAGYLYGSRPRGEETGSDEWSSHAVRYGMALLACIAFCATSMVSKFKEYHYGISKARLVAYVDSVRFRNPDMLVWTDSMAFPVNHPWQFYCRLTDEQGPETFIVTYYGNPEIWKAQLHKSMIFVTSVKVEGKGVIATHNTSDEEEERLIRKFEREFLSKLDEYIRPLPDPP